jgi:hypothetical protein
MSVWRLTNNMLQTDYYVSPFLQATKARNESSGIALLCLYTLALEGGEESASRPGRFLPPGKTRYPLYRRLGGPQGRSGHVRKISPPLEFDPRTLQPVQSLYWLSYPAHQTYHYLHQNIDSFVISLIAQFILVRLVIRIAVFYNLSFPSFGEFCLILSHSLLMT